jgi:hypothetical protein
MNEWIVLDPEPDVAIATGFAESEDAVTWVARALEETTDEDRIAMLKRCVVAPHDPARDS